MTTIAATILVSETRPFWLPELQRRFVETDVGVRGVRPEEIAADGGADNTVVVLVLDGRERECLELLGRFSRSDRRPGVIAIGSRSNADLEWPMRELGADVFHSTPPTSDDLVDLCRRLTDRNSENKNP